MTTSKFYLPSLYLISIFFFFNYSSPFIFWMITEVNLLLFISMIFFFSKTMFKQEMFDLVLFYFLIQSLASILLLSDFFFCDSFFIFNNDSMFIFALLLKLGIFPFFYWVFKVSEFLGLIPLILLITLQKIPFFLIFFSSLNILLSFILLGSFIMGSILIFFSPSFIFMMISSSVSSSFWLFYLYNFSSYFFFFFFFLYMPFLSTFYLKRIIMKKKWDLIFYSDFYALYLLWVYLLWVFFFLNCMMCMCFL